MVVGAYMKCYTKTGLLLLMISGIISILATIFMYSFWFSFSPENITPENFTSFFMVLIPAAVVGGIGGLFALIGAILMLIGRKEFGEKHRKFIFYAVLIFIISIVVMVMITVVIAFMTFSYVSQTIPNGSENMTDVFINNNFFSTIFLFTPISAALGGLIWVFGLYQLENKNGRMVLFAAFICMVVTAVVVAISSMLFFGDWVNSEAFKELINSSSYSSSSYSQIFTGSQWIGTTGVYSLIGNTVSNVLLIIAMYIPYKRITSGELIPISPPTRSDEQNRICPNCGEVIPFDAQICPYCSKQFETYL
ncbi:MAG: hypothetical protein JSW60_06265 [Thermoplasmatales archaeon]|nr:MAG: hypothetical protein JSW60_06265 [Thermoplasmatales archaeon]